MTFLFAAYTAIWICLFAYMLSVSRRQEKIQKDLTRVQEMLGRSKDS